MKTYSQQRVVSHQSHVEERVGIINIRKTFVMIYLGINAHASAIPIEGRDASAGPFRSPIEVFAPTYEGPRWTLIKSRARFPCLLYSLSTQLCQCCDRAEYYIRTPSSLHSRILLLDSLRAGYP